MNIQAEKLGLIDWISKLNDVSVLQKLIQVHYDYVKSPERKGELSLDEIQAIERGLDDVKEGRVHPHETVRKIYEKY